MIPSKLSLGFHESPMGRPDHHDMNESFSTPSEQRSSEL